jgi:hypothetical protein
MGLPGNLVIDMLTHMHEQMPMHSLDVEWRLMPLATARKLSLPEDWSRRYEEHNPQRREVLSVSSTVAGSPAADFFRAGDILLSVDGNPINSFIELERATQLPEVSVNVYRQGREVEQTVQTVALDGRGIDRVVLWAGALLQEPHRPLAVQRGVPPEGVYVSYFNFGSPASRSGLYAGRRIVAVDGKPTPDLDRFIDVVNGLGGRDAVRVNTVGWNDVPEVITLKLDRQYWGSYELRRHDYAWERRALEEVSVPAPSTAPTSTRAPSAPTAPTSAAERPPIPDPA